jgi:S1-C subfamily serine protease
MKVIMKRILLVLIVGAIAFASCSTKDKTPIDNNLYRILVGDKYGFMNAEGKVVIEPQFDDAYPIFSSGVCLAVRDGNRGLVDSTGNFIVTFPDSSFAWGNVPSVTSCRNFVNGYAKYYGVFSIFSGIIDSMGNVIVSCVHNNTSVNVDGDSTYFLIEDSCCVIMHTTGDTIGVPYDSVWYGFSKGLCGVKIGNKWGYINTSGKLVIDTLYNAVRTFSEERVARVRKGNEHMFIDMNGNVIIKVDSTLTGFTNNRAAVVMNGEKCLINKKGERICRVDADIIYPFDIDLGWATIVKNNKASVIDTMGNIILSSTNYDFIGKFIGAVAPVRKDEKWGYIDTTGTEIIPVENEAYVILTHNASCGLRAVQNTSNGYWCLKYYDLKGNLLWSDFSNRKKELPLQPLRQDYIEYFDDRISELDPIEGIYYVTNRDHYQSRNNPGLVGSNGSQSKFYAILRGEEDNEFIVRCVDKPRYSWANKFVKLGESNTYAIMSDLDDGEKYSNEGKVTIEDPSAFEFTLELGNNGWYNFYSNYEFVRDYPPVSEMEIAQRTEWTGTGFAIAEGYIATNYHITHGAKTIRIKGIGGKIDKSFKGFVVASDKEHDISIIKIVDKDFEPFGSIPYSIGKVAVDVGDNVFVLGYPMTQTMGEEIKVTNGVISAASGYKGDISMYQISAAVQPGNSGGPLFNEDGAVIGIICAKHADAENANYAIKVSYLYSLVNSELGIEIGGTNKVHSKKLGRKVKKYRDYVYLIECSSK